MSVGLDSSVVLRLLIGEPAEQAERARVLLQTAVESIGISDLVVGETYFALRHHYSVPHVEAIRALLALLQDPKVLALGVARRVLADPAALRVGKHTVGLMDRLILADYKREGLELLTFDRALSGLDGARDPGQAT